MLSLTSALSRTWRLHQKTSSGQCCPASPADKDTRRAVTFKPFCPCPSSHPVGGLVTLPASPSLDPLATEPPGHRRSRTRFVTSLNAFDFLACRACAWAHDVAPTARTQCPTTNRPACQDSCLWALSPVCSDPRLAGRLS